MRIPDLYRPGQFSLSFEIFPPKSAEGFEALYRTVGELTAWRPGFISCTYGAGGSTRDQTMEICRTIRARFGLAVTSHFTCLGGTVAEIRAWLTEARAAGIENIMALRGDPPKGAERFVAPVGGLSHANELVALIRSEFPTFGIGVAGYPEKHVEAPSLDDDLARLKVKVDAGGDAVFTQLFYDNEDFLRFRDQCAKLGIERPIVPGLLPVLSLAQVSRITALCGSKLPAILKANLEKAGDDADAQRRVGIEHATRQCEGLLAAGIPGIHWYVLNRSDSIRAILGNLGERLPGI